MALPRRFQPMLLFPGSAPALPDPRLADAEGLVAVGGDLSPERLLFSYERGVFPWYDDEVPPLWWSPNPRCVLEASDLHVSRRLQRTIRAGDFSLSWNRDFAQVISACGERPEGTWILPEMFDAYVAIHRLGAAHSLEVWRDEQLVGGLYGVQRGGLFAAESMFYRQRDMSKIALVALVRSLARAGVVLIDVQFLTPHLASLGAKEVLRESYLDRLSEACVLDVDLGGLKPSC